jgi:hypothetical protein
LVAVNDIGLQVVNAGFGPRHRDHCLMALNTLKAEGAWPTEAQCRPIWERIGANSLVILLSDDFDEGAVNLAERLSAARRDVLSIQILTTEERDFPFAGGYRFRDAEAGRELLTDGKDSRAEFISTFSRARKDLAARFASSGITHVEYVLDQPVDAPLRRLFVQGKARFQEGV